MGGIDFLLLQYAIGMTVGFVVMLISRKNWIRKSKELENMLKNSGMLNVPQPRVQQPTVQQQYQPQPQFQPQPHLRKPQRKTLYRG